MMPVVLQLAVRLGHGVRVDHQLLGGLPDRRQLVAGDQGAHVDRVFHLLDQLQVDGNAGSWISTGTALVCQ